MGNRSRSFVLVSLFGLAMLVAVAAGWLLAKRSLDLPQIGMPSGEREASATQKRAVHLYFADSNGRFLTAEQRVVDEPSDPAAAARGLIEALIQGPQQPGTRTLPRDAALRSLFVTGDGVAYVDFKAGSFDHHPGGIETELISIYSIVNTLVLNLDQIRNVKFLVGGQEAATLAGHVDVSHPFKADMMWVR
jgi:spore germination protein GerM